MPKIDAEDATGYQPIRAPRGTSLSCKGWQQEAALRMLMNNLDPEVAEKPEDLVVYGGRGKAASTIAIFSSIRPAHPGGIPPSAVIASHRVARMRAPQTRCCPCERTQGPITTGASLWH